MPFGLTNALATFQSLVNNTLKEYLDIFYIMYLDDILIYLETLEQHIKYIRKVLKAL
jgi:Reverse transcriptase (RNA-dependent DNA polymerase)